MKTTIYNNCIAISKNANVATASKSEIRNEINARNKSFMEDKRNSTNDFRRVYADWFKVYKMQPASKRIVTQFHVDTEAKLLAYLQPVTMDDAICCITTSDKRAASTEIVAQKKLEKDKTAYAVTLKWSVAAIEQAVKFSAEYYAGVHGTLAEKFNNMK